MDLQQIARWTHIGLGMCGFLLGAGTALAPKFGPRRAWHRALGRAYAVAMLGMAALSVPLAIRLGSRILEVIGILTLLAVALGWRAIRAVRTGVPSRGLLRQHMILMGSSYIAAWTAFLLTNPIVSVGRPWDGPLHMFGPTIVGSILIAGMLRRQRGRTERA